MSRIPAPLLLITDRSQSQWPLVQVIEQALEGGCRWVSLREKDWTSNDRFSFVRELLPLVRRFGGTLSVHADEHAARLADGLHLQAGSDVRAARARLGDEACIGLSCHTLDDVRFADRADYVTLGPVGPTLSKPGYAQTLDLDEIRKACRLGPPVLVLGGVDETNLATFKRAGAAGFAVMGSVMRSSDPRNLVRELLAAWTDA